MVGLAVRILDPQKSDPHPNKVRAAYTKLLKNEDYLEKVSRSTADDAFVRKRMELATELFREC